MCVCVCVCTWRACGRAGVRACGRAGVRACGHAGVRARVCLGVWVWLCTSAKVNAVDFYGGLNQYLMSRTTGGGVGATGLTRPVVSSCARPVVSLALLCPHACLYRRERARAQHVASAGWQCCDCRLSLCLSWRSISAAASISRFVPVWNGRRAWPLPPPHHPCLCVGTC